MKTIDHSELELELKLDFELEEELQTIWERFPNRVAFFDIDGTVMNNPMPELLKNEIAKLKAGRDGVVLSYLGTVCEDLRKAYKAKSVSDEVFSFSWIKAIYDIEKNGLNYDQLFGLYSAKVVEYVMNAMSSFTSEKVRSVAAKTLEKNKYKDYVFSRVLIEVLRELDFKLVAISGSPQFLVDEFVERYGFDYGIGQEFKPGENGVFEPVGRETWRDKHIIAAEILEEMNLPRNEVFILAVGDTLGDFSLLSEADLSFAVNPSSGLTREIMNLVKTDARKAGWMAFSTHTPSRAKFLRVFERKSFPNIGEIYDLEVLGVNTLLQDFVNQDDLRNYILLTIEQGMAAVQ